MKWNNYKKLSTEDREEWKFRFDKKRFPNSIDIGFLIYLMASIIMVSLVFILEKLYSINISYEEKLIMIVLLTILFFSISIGTIYKIVTYLVRYYEEKKWIKERIR